jgi:hypothetical protein
LQTAILQLPQKTDNGLAPKVVPTAKSHKAITRQALITLSVWVIGICAAYPVAAPRLAENINFAAKMQVSGEHQS